ncbi:MAG: oligopeptide/dipeptide ABC transporter ATP-binding protein, partial [Desulfobacterales bacterium]
MAQKNPQTVIRLEDVTKIYKSKQAFFKRAEKKIVALNQISLDIKKGEIFGLIGESGSGKTTAGRLIVKLEDPTAGKIFLGNSEIISLKGKSLQDFRSRVQIIFQDPYQSLNPQLSIYDTVSEPLTIHKIGDTESRQETVREAMHAVGLSPPEDFLARFPHQMSGGQRQRVAIARAVILKPEFIVADEPTSMLDASISIQIFNILLELRQKIGATLLFISHSLAAARYLCDRIAVVYRGNLVEMGPGEDVIQNPKHPYTQALIDALPKYAQGGIVQRYGTLLGEEREASRTAGCPFFRRCAMAHRSKCSLERPPLKEEGNA